jgi:hypothetical protein
MYFNPESRTNPTISLASSKVVAVDFHGDLTRVFH